MFKVGQKVVFIGLIECPRVDKNYPKINEICEITGTDSKGGYRLLGYEESECKNYWRWFAKDELRPLDENFADEVEEMVKESIKELELEKV